MPDIEKSQFGSKNGSPKSYPDGTNGLDDHDDISAIQLGINDFINDDDSGYGGPS